MSIYNEALEIIKKINVSGNQGFIVGGYVRDTLLGIQGKDVDLATNLNSNSVMDMFPDSKMINASQAWPIVHIHTENGPIEIATFRSDTPGALRNDISGIQVGGTLEQDATRRDFSFNSLYMDFEGNVLDPTGFGRIDLQNKIVRFNGCPFTRLQEDPCRALRAVRFALKLGFGFEEKTYEALRSFQIKIG